MAAYCGIELKNIVYEAGREHNKINADIYIGKKRVGEVLDDGWCDELYVEFIDERSERIFYDRKEKYCQRKGLINVGLEDFIRDMLYTHRLKEINKDMKKSRKPFKQLTFLMEE